MAYVINSLEVLQKVRPNNRDVIYTENPLIFERLRKNGKSLKSLSFLSQNELKILDNVAFLISTAWHQYINQFCKETCDCDLNIGDTINTYIFRLISILFYRSSQINHLLGLEKEIIIPFIDDQESLDQDSFRNLIPPVDYFSIIAKSGFFGEKVKTISISANKYNNNLFYESNVSIRPSFWKYYLLAFSVDPFWLGREIFFKLMPDTSSGAFRTGKHRRFTVLIYDRNRILERAWIPMRLKHIKLFKFDTPGFKVPEDISPSNNNAFQSLFQALIIMGKEKVNKSDTGTSDLSYAIEFSARA